MLYDYECKKCNESMELISKVDDRNNQHCPKCKTKLDRVFSMGKNLLDPFHSYISENMGDKPILIESREQRRTLLKEKGLDILPEKKRKYRDYTAKGSRPWVSFS